MNPIKPETSPNFFVIGKGDILLLFVKKERRIAAFICHIYSVHYSMEKVFLRIFQLLQKLGSGCWVSHAQWANRGGLAGLVFSICVGNKYFTSISDR